MKKNSGKLVEWKNKDNITIKGIARIEDQTDDYHRIGKVNIRLINEDYTEKKDMHQNPILIQKFAKDLIVIGYID